MYISESEFPFGVLDIFHRNMFVHTDTEKKQFTTWSTVMEYILDSIPLVKGVKATPFTLERHLQIELSGLMRKILENVIHDRIEFNPSLKRMLIFSKGPIETGRNTGSSAASVYERYRSEARRKWTVENDRSIPQEKEVDVGTLGDVFFLTSNRFRMPTQIPGAPEDRTMNDVNHHFFHRVFNTLLQGDVDVTKFNEDQLWEMFPGVRRNSFDLHIAKKIIAGVYDQLDEGMETLLILTGTEPLVLKHEGLAANSLLVEAYGDAMLVVRETVQANAPRTSTPPRTSIEWMKKDTLVREWIRRKFELMQRLKKQLKVLPTTRLLSTLSQTPYVTESKVARMGAIYPDNVSNKMIEPLMEYMIEPLLQLPRRLTARYIAIAVHWNNTVDKLNVKHVHARMSKFLKGDVNSLQKAFIV